MRGERPLSSSASEAGPDHVLCRAERGVTYLTSSAVHRAQFAGVDEEGLSLTVPKTPGILAVVQATAGSDASPGPKAGSYSDPLQLQVFYQVFGGLVDKN